MTGESGSNRPDDDWMAASRNRRKPVGESQRRAEMNENQYLIPENNLPSLEKKLKRIENKCKKYGCEFSYKIIGEEYREVKIDDHTGVIPFAPKITIKYIIIEAYGKAIYNGWRFIASIEHTSNGNIIRQSDYEITVPEKYQTEPSYCDHCKTDRRRNDTYLVMNVETGEFKQVGKSCLKDFTNGLSASEVSDYYSYFRTLEEAKEVGSGGGTRYFEKKLMAQYICECVNKYGFYKKDADYPTSRRALDFYMANQGMLRSKETAEIKYEMEKVNFDVNSDFVKNETENALNWILNNEETNNQYINNLKVVCGLEYIEYNHMGILASLFAAYYKAIQKEIEYKNKMEKDRLSEYVGTVNEKVTVNLQSFELLASWETQWGYTHLYKMTDTAGNVLIWKASKVINENQITTVTGTIKEHTEYKNVKQTVLTRCRVS